MATHSSILAWRSLLTKEPSRLQFLQLQRGGHSVYSLSQSKMELNPSFSYSLALLWSVSGKESALPIQETWVQALDWEDPLKKGMATHSSILAWEIPWTEEPGGLQSMGLQRVGQYLASRQQQIYYSILKMLLIKYSIKYFSLLHPTSPITNT